MAIGRLSTILSLEERLCPSVSRSVSRFEAFSVSVRSVGDAAVQSRCKKWGSGCIGVVEFGGIPENKSFLSRSSICSVSSRFSVNSGRKDFGLGGRKSFGSFGLVSLDNCLPRVELLVT